MTNPESTTVGDLCRSWLTAKAEESAANRRRLQIEADIVAKVGARTEGSQTSEADGFKVTTTGKQSISMDWDKWEQVKATIAANLWPVKTKSEVDAKGVRYLQLNEPEVYAKLPIEVKPAKTAVEVKAVAE